MLTELEEKEFTTFNCIAFDVTRVDSQDRGLIPPCWLCMSEKAKQEAKELAASWVSTAYRTITPFDVETARRMTERDFKDRLRSNVAIWRDMEITAKRLRAEGNPRAFFVPHANKEPECQSEPHPTSI